MYFPAFVHLYLFKDHSMGYQHQTDCIAAEEARVSMAPVELDLKAGDPASPLLKVLGCGKTAKISGVKHVIEP